MTTIQPRVDFLRELKHGVYDNLGAALKQGAAPSSSAAYEKALAKLGNTILMEQSPDLLPYTVGFQLLDKSDEGDFAAGFFIFDIGGSLVDCPIFLIKGKLKGYQMLHLREQGLFMPLLPEIIQYIMSKQDETLGEASFGEQEQRNNRTSTNFDVYSSQNRYLQKVGKFSDDQYPDHFTSWGRESGVLESYVNILKGDTAELVTKSAEAGCLPNTGWEELLSRKDAASVMWHWCQSSPRFAKKIAGMIGEDWAEKLSSYYDQRAEYIKLSSISLGQSPLTISPEIDEATKLAAFDSLDFVRSGVDRQVMADELLRYGAVFFDERESSKQAMLMVPTDESWTAPTESGLIEAPLASGDRIDLTAVVPKDLIHMGDNADNTMLVDVAGKRVARVISREVAANTSDRQVALEDEVGAPGGTANLPSFAPDSCTPDDAIILFDERGKATEPFRILSGSKDGGYEISALYLGTQGNRRPYGDSLPSARRTVSASDPEMLIISDDYDHMKVIPLGDDENVLCVPSSGIRVLKLKNANEGGDDDSPCGCEPETFKVLPLSQVGFGEIFKKASFAVQRELPNRVKIGGRSYTDRQAAMYLMTSGVSKTSALAVIDNAGERNQHYVVADEGCEPWQVASERKIALTPLEMQGDSDYAFRQPEEAARGVSSGQFPIPEEQGVREKIISDGMQMVDKRSPPWSSEESAYPEPQEYGGDGNRGGGIPGEQEEDQTSVFENTLFVSLINNVNPSIDREKLLSGLMKCANDTGHTLFLVYAHGDEFAKAYGISDAEELEEELLTVFESAGKLMVKLLNRSVGSSTDLQLSSFTDS